MIRPFLRSDAGYDSLQAPFAAFPRRNPLYYISDFVKNTGYLSADIPCFLNPPRDLSRSLLF